MSSDPQEKQQRPRRIVKGLASLWVLLFVLWLIINSSVEPPVVLSGLIVSFGISYVFVRRSNVWQTIDLTPRGAYHFVAYTGVFFIEMVKANINMLRYVYAPRIDIRPGIVKIDVALRSPIGRLALANSIALTPGSLVLDVKGSTMFIHWLDVQTLDTKEATKLIAGPFEEHLGVIFG